MGQRQDLITLLAGLEATIDPGITVYPLRPTTISTPAVYNWILTSPSEIPGTMEVKDTINIAVRVVVPTGDLDDEGLAGLGFADLTADVLDADLMYPAKSVLRAVVHEATRTSQRTMTDWFDSIPYLAWEFVVKATLRKVIPPS
jgi:hypothetical protein